MNNPAMLTEHPQDAHDAPERHSSRTVPPELAAPFAPEAVHWRVGTVSRDKKTGMALAYINARDVMDRLDTVIGPADWSDSYAVYTDRVVCTLSLWIGGAWVSKADGAGKTAVQADKGTLSDAFKRAAVKWGVGRYLYRLESPWVALVQEKYINYNKEGDRLLRILSVDIAPARAPGPDSGAVLMPTSPVAAAVMDMDKAEAAGKLPDWWPVKEGAILRRRAGSGITEADFEAIRAVYEIRTGSVTPKPAYDLRVLALESMAETRSLSGFWSDNVPAVEALPEEWKHWLRDVCADIESQQGS